MEGESDETTERMTWGGRKREKGKQGVWTMRRGRSDSRLSSCDRQTGMSCRPAWWEGIND